MSGRSGALPAFQPESAIAASAASARARGEPAAQSMTAATRLSFRPRVASSCRASVRPRPVRSSRAVTASQPPAVQPGSGVPRPAITTSARSGSCGSSSCRSWESSALIRSYESSSTSSRSCLLASRSAVSSAPGAGPSSRPSMLTTLIPRSRACRAISRSRALLPIPPGPQIWTTLAGGSSESRHLSRKAISLARPVNLVRSRSSSLEASVRRGGSASIGPIPACGSVGPRRTGVADPRHGQGTKARPG